MATIKCLTVEKGDSFLNFWKKTQTVYYKGQNYSWGTRLWCELDC